jgi:hypothetical protein
VSDDALLAGTEKPQRIRVNFLLPRDADAYDWDALAVAAYEPATAITS